MWLPLGTSCGEKRAASRSFGALRLWIRWAPYLLLLALLIADGIRLVCLHRQASLLSCDPPFQIPEGPLYTLRSRRRHFQGCFWDHGRQVGAEDRRHPCSEARMPSHHSQGSIAPKSLTFFPDHCLILPPLVISRNTFFPVVFGKWSPGHSIYLFGLYLISYISH